MNGSPVGRSVSLRNCIPLVLALFLWHCGSGPAQEAESGPGVESRGGSGEGGSQETSGTSPAESRETSGTSPAESRETSGAATAPSDFEDVAVFRDVAYGPIPYWNLLDIYVPLEGDGTARPVLFFVHGGAWNISPQEVGGATSSGDDKDDYSELGLMFAHFYRYVTVVIRYRLSYEGPDPEDGGAVFPEHVEDVAAAFAWVREEIAAYGGDRDTIFVMGHSAGAHLSALMATDARYLDALGHVPGEIGGLVLMSGAYDLTTLPPLFDAILYDTFGSLDRDTLLSASPFYFLDKAQPPTLLLYCWEDMPGFEEQSLDFYASLLPRQGRAWLDRLSAEEIPGELLERQPECHVAEMMSFSTPYFDSGPVSRVTAFIAEVLAGEFPPWQGPNEAQYWSPYLGASSNIGNHDGPYNSDFTFLDPPHRLERVRHLFAEDEEEDCATAAVATFATETHDDIRGWFYVTTGMAGGGNLHAFYGRSEGAHRVGDPVWDASSIVGPDGQGIDACAFISSPLIDEEGVIYISDCRFFWAISPEGQRRWSAPLPRDEDGRIRPFISAFFTQDGSVGGVTASGNLLIFSRDGEPRTQPFRIPGILRPQTEGGFAAVGRSAVAASFLRSAFAFAPADLSECLWHDADGGDMVDPAIQEQIVAGMEGVEVPVSNQPAVFPDPDPHVTRIYVPAILEQEREGKHDLKLFRIDFTVRPGEGGEGATYTLEEAEAWRENPEAGLIPGGEGTASSPDVAFDGSAVYLSDIVGNVHAFDAEGGEHLWSREVGKVFGSLGSSWPTANHPEHGLLVMTLEEILLLDPGAEGRIVWRHDYSAELSRGIEPVPGYEIVAVPDGLPVQSPNRILIPFLVGYRLSEEELPVWPVRSLLAHLARDGTLLETFDLLDSVEVGAIPDLEGFVHVTYAGLIASVTHCFWQKGLFPRLPEPLCPHGGLDILGRGALEAVEERR